MRFSQPFKSLNLSISPSSNPMMHEDKYEQIEAYLSGTLPENEAAAFESDMAADPTLKQATDMHKLTHDSMEILIENSLRGELEKLRAEESATLTSAKIVPMRRMRFVLAAAASVILLLGLFTWNWAGQNYSNQGLTAANYEAFQSQDIRWGNQEVALDNAFAAYENGDLENAVQLLLTVPVESDYYAEAQYVLGHIRYQQDKSAEAIQAFKNTIAQNHPRLNQKAEWNLALTYLNSNRIFKDFWDLLDKIATTEGHSYQQDAIDLKKDLGSFWRGLAR